MDWLHLIVEKFGKDLSPGRMFESLVLLSVIWSRLKPHLKKIEARILGVELAVKQGFEADQVELDSLKTRVKKVENKLGIERNE